MICQQNELGRKESKSTYTRRDGDKGQEGVARNYQATNPNRDKTPTQVRELGGGHLSSEIPGFHQDVTLPTPPC